MNITDEAMKERCVGKSWDGDCKRDVNRKCSVCGAPICGFHGRAKPDYKDVTCPDCRKKKR